MSKDQRFDIHQHITGQIVAAIERGAGEFRLPWHQAAGDIIREPTGKLGRQFTTSRAHATVIDRPAESDRTSPK
jgi:antirestriction protein ArdC